MSVVALLIVTGLAAGCAGALESPRPAAPSP